MKSSKKSFFQSTLFYLLVLILIQVDTKAQEPDSTSVFMDVCGDASDQEIFIIVDTWPSFPGGNKALYRYLKDHVKFPPLSIDSSINSRIYCQFYVSADGSISDVSVIRGMNKVYDSIAIKAIENMPNWIPGKRDNKSVKTRFHLPIIVCFDSDIAPDQVRKSESVSKIDTVTIVKQTDTIKEEEVEERVTESKPEKNPKVKIYPNPVQEELFYSVYNTNQNVSFQIIDAYGQKHKWGYLRNSGAVQVGELKPGLYIFQTIQNNEVATSVKWIKL